MAKIRIDKEKCKGCGLCIMYCPKGFIVMTEHMNALGAKTAGFKQDSLCTGCSFCAIMCPDCAIEIEK